jgi:ATP-dependent DNA ligase
VVAKKRSSGYRSGERGWVKVKNPAYWRRDAEREAVAGSHERRGRRTPKQSAMAPSPS